MGTSIVFGSLYILFPRNAGFLEAGHFGPFIFFAYLPFLLLSCIRLVKTPNFGYSCLFAVSLAGLYFSFPSMFVTAAVLSLVTLFIARSVGTLLFFAAGALITFGLVAITFLPQLEWIPQTTRLLLLSNPDVYPKWNSKIEFIGAMYPYTSISRLDSEKWMATGIFISILALVGFSQLSKKNKIIITIAALGTILIALNNVSPIYSILLSNDWYVLGRVSTRVWFLAVLIFVFLAGAGFEKLVRGRRHKLAIILALLAIAESSFLSWKRLLMPPQPQEGYAPKEVFEFLKKDPAIFRVFCVTRCLSQKDVAKYNLQTVEGYETMYQKNYYDQSIQLSQAFHDRYSAVLPPFEIYHFREIQPYSPELAGYNIKYVISPYRLKDKNFILKGKINNFRIYENTVVKGRAYFGNGHEAKIISYLPNYIKVDTSAHETKELIVAEVYNSGWIAKLNGQKETRITQTKNKLRQVDIGKDTQFVEMYYDPKSYRVGKIITALTLIGIPVCLFRRKQSPQ